MKNLGQSSPGWGLVLFGPVHDAKCRFKPKARQLGSALQRAAAPAAAPAAGSGPQKSGLSG